MSNLNNRIEDTLLLVEQNFDFLNTGMFLSQYIRNKNLSLDAKNVRILRDGNKEYWLSGDVITETLRDSFVNWNKVNILEYLVEWNAFRGIGMAMQEGLKVESTFKNYVKSNLGNRYEHFYSILSFIRNVLSHNINAEIRLEEENYKGTSKYFIDKVDPSGIAKFTYKYADDMPDVNPQDINYGFTIEVNFSSLQLGVRFLDVISEWQLFMFSELCYNLVHSFRMTGKTVRQSL